MASKGVQVQILASCILIMALRQNKSSGKMLLKSVRLVVDY